MKTPEEIKKGLEACGADECHGNHTGCPYKGYLFCIRNVCGDALAYIQQLESRLDQVERERDELICQHIPQTCDTCKYSLCFSFDNPCNKCNHLYRFNAVERGDTDCWEFVGVCAQNSKEE